MNPRTAVILAGVALVVGVVGLVIGISAKNGNKSDEHISQVAQQQLEQQLGSTASQVQGQVKAQGAKAAETATSVDKQLRSLQTSVNAVQNSVNTLNTTDGDAGDGHQEPAETGRQARYQGEQPRRLAGVAPFNPQMHEGPPPERRPFAFDAVMCELGICGGAGRLPPPFARRCPGWIPPDGRVPS